jgi:hypothetical protein
MLSSAWYLERLEAKRHVDERLWKNHVTYLESFLSKANYREEARRLDIERKLGHARSMLKETGSSDYIDSLRGTLGANPSAAKPLQEQGSEATTKTADAYAAMVK